MSNLKSMASSASGKRSKMCGSRRIGPELPDVSETHAEVFACDKPKPKAKKPTLRKSLGKSLKKWWSAWCKDFHNDEKILRREEHQRRLEVNRIVISFGL
ncbi:hypothetical protein Mapa_014397 [Marchantia paleacea]|nr:hypothetical protein Mapa_014397 [Marchantia paleacea]